ncbi:hypothetical protein lerEdw1_007650 [Lerista edwardsae]|nr:hypothetical protein lerEdw1_007650 [Lerista edwardsae]
MGSRRLLPLLALLGAAGLQSSEWDGPPAQEPSTILEPEGPRPGSAAPPSSTREPPPSSSALFSTPPQPSLAEASADPELSPGGGPRGTAAVGQGPALGTAGGRTQPPLLEAGRTAAIGAPKTPGGRPLAPTWPPPSGGAPPPSETLGPEGEAATAKAQATRLPPPHDRSSSSSALATGLEPCPQHPGGSEAPEQLGRTPGRDPEAEPTELVGPPALGTALPPSLAGAGHTPEVTEAAAVPDSTGGSTTAAPDPHSAALGQGARGREETLPPSAATPSQGAGGAGAAPHSSPSPSPSSAGAALSLAGSAAPPAGSDPALLGGSPAPGPTSLAWSGGPAQPPADATEGPAALGPGQDASPATAPHQSPADPPPDSAPRQDRDGETWGSRDPPGPWPSRPPLRGAFPGPARSSSEPPARPAGAGEEARRAQPGGGGFTPDAAPRQATDGTWMGAAPAEVQPLVGQTPGRGAEASQAPGLTGPPKGSGTASLSAEGDPLDFAPAEDPARPPSRTAAPSTPAGPTRGAGASDRPGGTLWPGASPAGTQRWAWGRHPGAPTESPAREKLARTPPGTGGPVQAAAPSGPLESTRPPVGSTRPLAPTRPAPAGPSDVRGRGRHVFVAGNQRPLLKATFLRVPCELALAMEFSRSFRNPRSSEYQGLVLSINETVAPLLAPLPGFQRLEVKTLRPGSVVVEFDALFLAEAPGLWAALNRSWLAECLPPGLRVADAGLLRRTALERRLDLCATLFACPAGYECVAGEDGDAACTSLCHRDYCQNQGICTHEANHVPVCQCPVGSGFWYLGLRCNYRVTQQGLLGVACGLLLSLVLVGTAVASLVVRRVRALLLEARADQTKSSYRRFCRLDDVSAHYWSEPWLASGSSLDNPAFSHSEELLHLQILDPDCCGCRDDCGAPSSCCKQAQGTPGIGAVGRPSFHFSWDTSSTSVNDPMVDSGKASEVSVSSWPLEPIQWSPSPVLHKLSGQQAHKSPQRPRSYCEGVELVNLERSWTA